jgi:ABC-type multidrug transport system ATPase subunit
MGPSGGGKSSLLNVLAGRSASVGDINISGLIKVGGKEINPVTYRRQIAYVMQDDALLATSTPREALRFSATLRLPSSVSKKEINEMVDALLSELGIMECADVIIGGALLKGISGGQRKRASVGVEVITDPEVLFLDEPTSGLDSDSAFNLVKLLKNIASTNCTILCTIHQPSSEIFALFDTVIYLKDGVVVFQGATEDVVPYFANLGRVCPNNYNPSDFVMTLIQQDSLQELKDGGIVMTIPDRYMQEVDLKSSRKLDIESVKFVAQSSWFKQLYYVTEREAWNVARDVPSLIGRFGITIILNLLYGLIFLNAGGKGDSDLDNFNAHVGAVSMIVINALFGSSQSVLLSFPFERPMILREYATGTYHITAYFVAKMMWEFPMTFVQMIVQFLLVFYLCNLRGDFIIQVLACTGLGMVSNSVAMGIGCLVPDVKDATELAPLLFVPQILFAGFFIRTSQIPIFLRWAQYLCGMKYGMNLVLINEFQLGSEHCNVTPEANANCRSVLEANDIDLKAYYIYIILLFVLFAAFRAVGIAILVQKAKRFY